MEPLGASVSSSIKWASYPHLTGLSQPDWLRPRPALCSVSGRGRRETSAWSQLRSAGLGSLRPRSAPLGQTRPCSTAPARLGQTRLCSVVLGSTRQDSALLGRVRPCLLLPDSARRWTRRGPSLAPRRLAASGWASRVEAPRPEQRRECPRGGVRFG